MKAVCIVARCAVFQLHGKHQRLIACFNVLYREFQVLVPQHRVHFDQGLSTSPSTGCSLTVCSLAMVSWPVWSRFALRVVAIAVRRGIAAANNDDYDD